MGGCGLLDAGACGFLGGPRFDHAGSRMIYIWTRRTADWADDEAFRAQLKPEFAPMVDLWDRTFAIPYREFRHEVRCITRDNQKQIVGAQASRLDDVPAGSLVIPTDDDDWFAPDTARVVAEHHREGVLAHRWISSWLEVKIDVRHWLSATARRGLPGAGQKYTCTTNNYAFVMGPHHRQIMWHTGASRWVDADPARAPVIPRRLSLMNRTLASMTSLLRPPHRPVGRRALLRKYERYRRLYRRPLPHEELGWAQPYVDRMAALMDGLEPRR